MKKAFVTVLLVASLVTAMATQVSAGTKKTSAFTLNSYFINKIETVYVSSDCVPYYSLDVGTDAVWPKYYSGRLTSGSKIFQSGSGLAGYTWYLSTMGYVTGNVDGTKISFTDS